MKHVEIRHGCLDAVLCGDKATHLCGATDACNAVKSSGVVCTFGTTQRVTFHELSDIEAEVVERSAHHEKAHGSITPADTAAIRVTAAAGKNLHSPKAEKDFTDAGHKHHTDNKSLHDSNPEVFGHD